MSAGWESPWLDVGVKSAGKGQPVAYFDINLDVLAELLKMPEGTKVLRVEMSQSRHDTACIHIENPHFASVDPGQPVPRVSPTYRRETTEIQTVGGAMTLAKVVFESWGND